MMKLKIEGEGTVSFAIGSVLKRLVNLNVRSKQSQFEAEKMPAQKGLKTAENRVTQDSIIDNPAKGTMNRLATMVTKGTRLK
jgi:hypothetical protein